jgi:hypothetical protein
VNWRLFWSLLHAWSYAGPRSMHIIYDLFRKIGEIWREPQCLEWRWSRFDHGRVIVCLLTGQIPNGLLCVRRAERIVKCLSDQYLVRTATLMVPVQEILYLSDECLLTIAVKISPVLHFLYLCI